jgi:hypothetical protein
MTPTKKSAGSSKKPTKAPAKPAAVKPKAAKKPAAPAKAAKKAAPGKGAAAKPAPGKKKAEAAKPAAPPKPGALVVARDKLKPKLGVRWTCWSCGLVFYDLNKPQPICPRCQADPRKRPESERGEEPPRKRDTIRALRVLDDEEAVVPEEEAGEELDLDLELGADEKLLDEAEEPEPDED